MIFRLRWLPPKVSLGRLLPLIKLDRHILLDCPNNLPGVNGLGVPAGQSLWIAGQSSSLPLSTPTPTDRLPRYASAD